MGKRSGADRPVDPKTEGGKVKPIPASRRAASRLGLWRDVQDIAMMQIDALVVLLIGALVVLPLAWLFAGDLFILVAYVIGLALIFFVLFYVALIYIDGRVAALDAMITEGSGRQRPGKKR